MGDPFGSARLEYALRVMSKKDKREAFNLIRTANAVVFGWRLEKPNAPLGECAMHFRASGRTLQVVILHAGEVVDTMTMQEAIRLAKKGAQALLLTKAMAGEELVRTDLSRMNSRAFRQPWRVRGGREDGAR